MTNTSITSAKSSIKTRHLTLIRHAKSSWQDAKQSDKLRPLAKRGQKDCLTMAQANLELLNQVDHFYCSTAVRAIETMAGMLPLLNISEQKISYDDQLYVFDNDYLINFIKQIDNRQQSIAILGHNPALTDLANFFLEEQFVNLPTCSILKIRFDCTQWERISHSDARLMYFDCPKNHD